MDDLAARRARHFPFVRARVESGSDEVCGRCEQIWPCDAAVLGAAWSAELGRVAFLRAEIEQERQARQAAERKLSSSRVEAQLHYDMLQEAEQARAAAAARAAQLAAALERIVDDSRDSNARWLGDLARHALAAAPPPGVG